MEMRHRLPGSPGNNGCQVVSESSRGLRIAARGEMNRRLFLSFMAGCAAWPAIAEAIPRPTLALRRLRLVNAHTGETFDGAYRNDKGPIERVIDELCVFLRDHHSGEQTQIDVGVIDFLADVLDAVGDSRATILSAYRTAETNAMLAHTTFGVAEHSQHMEGHAIDLRVPGVATAKLRDAALSLRAGGVGYYPVSQFVHVDVGPVREWVFGSKQRRTILAQTRRVRSSRSSGAVAGQ